MNPRIVVPAFAAMTTLSGIAAAEADPLDAYRWRSRVLVIVAPDAADTRFTAQRQALAAVRGDLDERDLVTVEAIGRENGSDALRRRFNFARDGFHVVLIGKDGGPKLSSDEPIPAEKLFDTIDAMPMRQQEMKR